MVPTGRDQHKRPAALHEKLQLLRSLAHSRAVNKTSIIVDASNYIEELKQKVKRLHEEIACERNIIVESTLPAGVQVSVETLEKGFLINVYSKKSSPGLLVSVLEVFEEFGLTVMEARASCTDTFRLQAVGGETQIGIIDANVVKQAVLQAIKDCTNIISEQE